MAKITDLKRRSGRKKRMSVFLDGEFAFSLQAEVVAREGLQIGQELAEGRIQALTGSDSLLRCLDAAARYLSYRPRSEHEVRQRLGRRGFDGRTIEAAVARLKEQGLVDDAAFARFWKENRDTFSPRSQQLTRMELRRKGVTGEVIDQAVDSIDNRDNARRAALSRSRRLPSSDYQEFRRRLGEYLRRRGFGYEVIGQTVAQVWQEMGTTQGNGSTEPKAKPSEISDNSPAPSR